MTDNYHFDYKMTDKFHFDYKGIDIYFNTQEEKDKFRSLVIKHKSCLSIFNEQKKDINPSITTRDEQKKDLSPSITTRNKQKKDHVDVTSKKLGIDPIVHKTLKWHLRAILCQIEGDLS